MNSEKLPQRDYIFSKEKHELTSNVFYILFIYIIFESIFL